jgi:hypothetical protein
LPDLARLRRIPNHGFKHGQTRCEFGILQFPEENDPGAFRVSQQIVGSGTRCWNCVAAGRLERTLGPRLGRPGVACEISETASDVPNLGTKTPILEILVVGGCGLPELRRG